MTLERYLERLEDGEEPLKYSGLVQLSGLSQHEILTFKRVWANFKLERKTDVLSRLIEMAEDNPELDFDAVFWTCLKENSEEVRERALEGLWECDDRTLINPIISLLTNDPSEKVRSAAAIALGKFASLAEDEKLLSRDGDRIREALFEALKDPKEVAGVKRRVIEAVSAFALPEVKEAIDEAYHSPKPELRYSAIFAMGKSGDPSWLPRILKELDSNDPAMRYEAANACGELGEEGAVPYLINLLEDHDTQVQVSAVEALGAVGGSLAKKALQRCLKLGDLALEEAAETALRAIETNEDPLSFRVET